MRTLIVSSLVSVDGVHSDPQSWPRLTALPANELLGQRARQCGRPRVSQ
jgi:hypothetical protein